MKAALFGFYFISIQLILLLSLYTHLSGLYPVYTMKQTSSKYQAKIKQTSNKHETIRANVVHVYIEYVCMMSA